MRHSVYLKLATVLIRADLRHEERAWKRKVRRSAYDLPWLMNQVKNISVAADL